MLCRIEMSLVLKNMDCAGSVGYRGDNSPAIDIKLQRITIQVDG